jgi:hypothetical protein
MLYRSDVFSIGIRSSLKMQKSFELGLGSIPKIDQTTALNGQAKKHFVVFSYRKFLGPKVYCVNFEGKQ